MLWVYKYRRAELDNLEKMEEENPYDILKNID